MLSKKNSFRFFVFRFLHSILKIKYVFFVFCFLFFEAASYGQCAMCRAALTGEGNAVKAEAVNDGIVYLMVFPYILVGAIGYYIYRMKRKKD